MRIFLLVFLLGGACALFFWLRSDARDMVPAERLVEPRRGDIVRGVIAVGRVEPRTRVEVQSKANGIIQKFYVDVGDDVHEGQVLVQLDRELLEARVAEVEGRLTQAVAARELAGVELERYELEKEDPELRYAERHWERTRKLFEDKLTSQQDRDVALERYEQAKYRLRILDARLAAARAAITAAEGRVQESRAQADLARQELTEATIRSPINGTVLYRYLEEGDSVSSIRVAGGNATNIMTLGDLSELYVDGQLDEVDVGKILAEQRVRPDLAARVTVESFRAETFMGRVARVTPLGLEDRNGIITFEVRIVLENPERRLLANMTANSVIVLEEKADVLLLSQGALTTEEGVAYATVYDARSGRSQRRAVTVGIADGTQVEIVDGIEPGETVLIP